MDVDREHGCFGGWGQVLVLTIILLLVTVGLVLVFMRVDDCPLRLERPERS